MVRLVGEHNKNKITKEDINMVKLAGKKMTQPSDLEKHFFPAKDIQYWQPPHLFSYLSNNDYNRVYDTLKRSLPHLHDFLDIGHLASGPGRVCKFLLHYIMNTTWLGCQLNLVNVFIALTETYVSACQSCPLVLLVTLGTGGVARGI
ncbi:hypothetical protein L228DRAFT_244773 [Xylona heveae TC161]|uniref:Uncharacterized protein n=1 Tax=Xylona heveae (strain CBS 132557 / TC161) TaxID=1328760 RepID=A0A165J7B2_XYLHT|nr:hypothetical protein L228DRAFT_244773 [Xylona heveae TC161]KZF25839.1 hypothetical protein L228DRAFT_244773 [Xylona heveae TC161]